MLNFLVVVVVLLSAVALLLGAVLLFRKYGWPMKYMWAIPVVVFLGLGVWWGISSLGPPNAPPVAPSSSGWSLEAPSPKTVWESFKDYWLWMILVLAILFFASNALSESWVKAVKGMMVTVAVVLVGAMIVHGIWGEKSPSEQVRQVTPQECTSTGPCVLVVRTDGSTERAHIPQGKSVCFEPFFWSNIQRLGYKTSYKGGPEGGTGVSADTFWFVPESGARVPRHWFVQEGATQC